MAFVTLPKTNQTGTNEWEDVEANDRALRDAINGNLDATNLASNAVTTAKITDKAVTGAKVADDVVGVYQTLLTYSSRFDSIAAAGTYVARGNGNWNAIMGTQDTVYFYLRSSAYSVTGRTTYLRVVAEGHVNGTSPGTMTFVVGLYPVTVSGGAGALTYTLGSVVSGSTATVSYTGVGTNTIRPHTSGGADFGLPANGLYTFGCVTNAAIAADSVAAISCQLQLHHA